MDYNYLNLNNIQLAYLDQNTDSEKIIFFIHGNSVSSSTWKEQFNNQLFQDYRLIAIDLPAHGESDASAHPFLDYNIPGLGSIMATAIRVLAGSHPYLLVSLSLGTCILAEALEFGLHPQGIVLAGSCIVGGEYTLDKVIKPNTNVHVVFTEQSPENEVREYAKEVMLSNDRVEEFVSDYYKVKPLFRSHLMSSIQDQKYNDHIELITATQKALLVVFGKDEQIVNADYLDDAPLNLWRDTIFKLPGASHLLHLDQPEAFNQLLIDYVSDVMA